MSDTDFKFKKTAMAENSALLNGRIDAERVAVPERPAGRYTEPDDERGQWFHREVLDRYARGNVTTRYATHVTAHGLQKWYGVQRTPADADDVSTDLVRYHSDHDALVPCDRVEVGAMIEEHLHEFATSAFCQEVYGKILRQTTTIEGVAIDE